MAGSFDAEVAVDTALPPAPGPMPTVWSAGGGLSLGRTVGARDDGAVECGSQAGAGVELAGYRAPVRAELEKRGDDREAGGAVRIEAPARAAGACDRH